MFRESLNRGVRMLVLDTLAQAKALKGLQDDSYIACTEKAVRAIMSNIASDGTVQNVSGGTGIGVSHLTAKAGGFQRSMAHGLMSELAYYRFRMPLFTGACLLASIR